MACWLSIKAPHMGSGELTIAKNSMSSQDWMFELKIRAIRPPGGLALTHTNSVRLTQMSTRIVLIDDAEAELWLLQRCLDTVAINHEIIVLADGEAALQFIEMEREGIEPRPCVIVLDLHLSGYDGLEILAAIRRAPVLEHVAALIVSAMPSPQMQRRIADMGVPYAEKPLTISGYEALAAQIWELCESMHHGTENPETFRITR